MRFRITMLAVLAAVALSSAPAHASPPLLSCGADCGLLLPGYWQGPGQPACDALLALSCGWY
jgi:hypothetical protein